MKVPININSKLWPFRLTMIHQTPNTHEIGKGGDKAPPFERLLTDRIKSILEKGDSSIKATPPDRERLKQLIDSIQMQIDSSLFRLFSDSNEDLSLNGSHLNWRKSFLTASRKESLASKTENTLMGNSENRSLSDIGRIIDHASKQYGVDPDFTRAVVKAESDFDVNCTSSKGAMGLMQLMPETAEDLGVKNPYDPVENVMAGTRYLKSLLDRYDGNISLALAAYNWGMGNIERNPDRLPKETSVYITRVKRYYHNAKT